MTAGIEGESRRGFVGNWVSGGGDSRSQRRRLMAVLRMAHRVLGVSRKGLGLGTLGAGGTLASALYGSAPAAPCGAATVLAEEPTCPNCGRVFVEFAGKATKRRWMQLGWRPAAAAALGALALSVSSAAPAQAQNYTAGGGTVQGGAVDGIAIGCVGFTATVTTAAVSGGMAIGCRAVSGGTNSVAIGVEATTTGQSATAIGVSSDAAVNAAAYGALAQATGVASSAFGLGATASGLRGVAIGSGATQAGIDSIAQGTSASAGSQNAIAIGFQSVATSLNSINIGARTVANTGALAIGAIALGTDTTASEQRAIAMGVLARATGVNALAFGTNAAASGPAALALGASTVSSGINSVALGVSAQAALGGDNALGTLSIASGGNSTAVGTSTRATGSSAFAGGWRANASGVRAVAIGVESIAAGNQAIALGDTANASAQNAIAAGTGAVADSADAVAIGTGATATGGKAVAIGAGNVANGNGAVAIGDPSTATGDGAVAQGMDNTATGNGSVAMGNTNMVGGGGQAVSTPGTPAQGAVGIGYQNTVVGQGSVAIGSTSSALAAGAIAFGDTAVANNAGDVALGSGSVTGVAVGTPSVVIDGTTYNFAGTTPTSTVSVGVLGAERTITNVAAGRISGSSTDAINGSQLFATNQAVDAIGATVNNINDGAGIKYFHANSALPDSQALGTNSVAIGPNAVANNAGDVAIGLNAVSGATTAVSGATIGGTAYSFAGATPAGAFSVGALGAERQIQNVAAGQLSNSSTDAVNGSQLFATNQQVTQNTTDITNLDNAINNIAGDTSTGYTDANGDGIRYVRTNDRTLPLADSSAQGIGSTAVGYEATAAADNSLALGRDSQATIDGGVALGAGSISDRALAPATGQLPAGSTVIEYNTTDKTLLGAVSVGTDTAYRQITNVADGTNAQDAVTIRQLQGAIAAVATTPSMYFHANSAAGDSLAVGAESIAVGPTTVVNGDNGIGIGNGAIVDQIAPGGTAIGQNAHVMLADGIALGTNSRSAGIQSVAIGAGAQSNHANSVALGSGSATQATVATSSTTINGQTYNFAGAAPVGTVSVGTVGNERTITNVAAGRISATSTDAINGSQLYATNLAIENLSDQIGDVEQIADNAIQYDTVTNSDGSVTKINKITLQGGDPSAPVVISNVGAGVADTDAVNVAQLNEGMTEVIETANSYTDQVAVTTLDQANDYTDQKFDELNQAIDGVQDEARQAAAIGLAAASLRYDDRPGKVSVAMGGGLWRGEGAVAFGAGYTSENGRVRANLMGTTAGGHWGAGAGLSFTLN